MKIARVKSKFLQTAFVVLCVASATGCTDSSRQEATGQGRIRGINAIVDSPDMVFLIEEVTIDNAAFKAVAGYAEYDDLSYAFNFDANLPEATTLTRIASQNVDVAADTEYTLVLTGSLANPSISIWEDATRTFSDTDTTFEADFVHFSPTQGEVDIYFATSGTTPMLGQAIDSLNNGERIPLQEFPGGDYEIIVTSKDDPTAVLFQSASLAAVSATRVTFAIFDADPTITSTIGVNLIDSNGASSALSDINSPVRLRVLHAAFGTDNFDGFVNDDFTTVVYPNIGFGELSDYVESATGVLPTTLTSVGNVGNILIDQDVSIPANSNRTVILGGDPANLIFRDLADDARPVSSFPVVRLTNMSVNASPIDIYWLDPGTPISGEVGARFAGVPFALDTLFFAGSQGNFEVTVTASGETSPISTALPLSLQNGDIFDIVVVDTADPNVVDLIVFDSQFATP